MKKLKYVCELLCLLPDYITGLNKLIHYTLCVYDIFLYICCLCGNISGKTPNFANQWRTAKSLFKSWKTYVMFIYESFHFNSVWLITWTSGNRTIKSLYARILVSNNNILYICTYYTPPPHTILCMPPRNMSGYEICYSPLCYSISHSVR